MKAAQKTISDQVVAFLTGKYDAKDLTTQCEAGWWDWFCPSMSLVAKTQKLYKKLICIIKSKKFDVKTTYVFFKNNCPMVGSLYDDFRICDIETGDVIYTVTPSSGHRSSKGIAEVWGKENNFQEALIEGTWKEIVKWFLAEEKRDKNE